MKPCIIVIIGCTASGKGALARSLAETLAGEILSIDSMKVYRGFDIGTAKPSPAEQAAIPHHLIDVADPWEAFSAARFVQLADTAVREVHARGRPVVAVGGTVLYFKCWYEGIFAGPAADAAVRAELRARARSEGLAVLHAELERVDPAAAARIHRNDLRRVERALEVFRLTGRPISTLQRQWDNTAGPRRPEWNWLIIGVRRSREESNHRINMRVKRMVEVGLLDEVRRLAGDPRGLSDQARQAVGYAELLEHLAGRWTLAEAVERVKIHTRRLAKQQRTWLKRMPYVQWLDTDASEPESSLVARALALVRAAGPEKS